MKNFKCINCNNKLDLTESNRFITNEIYDCQEIDDHYFYLNLSEQLIYSNIHNKEIDELSYYSYDSEGLSIYFLEIKYSLNKYYYTFKKHNSVKIQTIVLDNYILNDLYNKFLNETLTVNCIEKTISKLDSLVLFA